MANEHPKVKKQKARFWIAAGALSLLLLIAGAWFVARQSRPLRISAAGLSESSSKVLAAYMMRQGWLGRKAALVGPEGVEPVDGSVPDIRIASWTGSPVSDEVSVLDGISVGSMPGSIQAIGLGKDGDRLALPIALDHVELAFRRDLFARNGLVVENRIVSFSDLNTVLHAMVAKDFFPLLVAGGDDRALLDFLAVLVVSMGGLGAYEAAEKSLSTFDWQNGGLPAGLSAIPALRDALDWMRTWKRDGVLHPEWLAFRASDVLSIARLRLTASCVMRLSEHRQWPVGVLQNWQASPFPFRDPQVAGSALLAPVVVVMVPRAGRYAKKLVPLVAEFSGEVFQETVVQDWGLAPVLGNAEALDRESGDLRFWAAASRRLLPGWDAELSGKSMKLFSEAVRIALR